MPSTVTDRIDGLTTSVAVKAPVVAATTGNITLSGTQTIDSVAVTADDRVLVKDQTTASENGIYNVSSTTWARVKDFNGARDAVTGTLVWDTNGGVFYVVSTTGSFTIGTSDIQFSLASSLNLAGVTEASNIAGMTSLLKSALSDDQQIDVGGYTITGDGGGGKFYWDSSSSATADGGTIIASDEGGATGRWLRILNGARTTPAMFNAKGDGATDDQAALQLFAAHAGPHLIENKTYVTTEEIEFGYGSDVHSLGGTIDASAATVAGGFPNNNVVRAGDGGSLTALPALNSAASRGDQTLTFASAPSVVEGQIIVLYNSTNASWQGERAAYHAGEMCRVASVSGSVVTIYGKLYDDYATSIDTYLLVGGSFIHSGRLKIICPPSIPAVRGFRGRRLIDSNISGIQAEDSGNASISLSQCFNVRGDNIIGRQSVTGSLGTDYGLVIGNSQHIHLDGYFGGLSHGVAVGGGDEAGAVVNRDVVMRGTFKSAGTLYAANLHGNCEFCGYIGHANGGFNLGGDNNFFEGSIQGLVNGITVKFSEMKGWNHRISGEIMTDGDPELISRGMIDVGGNDSTSANANTDRGGTLDLSGLRINGPIADKLIAIRNRGSAPTEPIYLKLDGITCDAYADTGAKPWLLIDAVSGDDFDMLNLANVEIVGTPEVSVANVTRVRGPRESGKESFALGSGVDTTTQAVVFGRPFPSTPHINVTPDTKWAGSGPAIIASIASESATGFTITIYTADSSNFVGTPTIDVHWQAMLEQ